MLNSPESSLFSTSTVINGAPSYAGSLTELQKQKESLRYDVMKACRASGCTYTNMTSQQLSGGTFSVQRALLSNSILPTQAALTLFTSFSPYIQRWEGGITILTKRQPEAVALRMSCQPLIATK